SLWQPLAEDARRHRALRRDGGEARFYNFCWRMAGRCPRRRSRAQAERWNRSVRLQLRRAGIPFHGRPAAQRYWTSPCGNGKEHRAGARWRGAAIQKRRKQEVEIRREKRCTFGRGDQIAFIIAGEAFGAAVPAP